MKKKKRECMFVFCLCYSRRAIYNGRWGGVHGIRVLKVGKWVMGFGADVVYVFGLWMGLVDDG